MGEEANYTGGIALIVEGATEKVFYSELIRLRALVHGATVERASDGNGTSFSVTRQDGSSELVKINNVGTVTQMTNSAEWFLRACGRRPLDSAARLWYTGIQESAIRRGWPPSAGAFFPGPFHIYRGFR